MQEPTHSNGHGMGHRNSRKLHRPTEDSGEVKHPPAGAGYISVLEFLLLYPHI